MRTCLCPHLARLWFSCLRRSNDGHASEVTSRVLVPAEACLGAGSQHSAAAFELPWGGAPPALSQRRLQPQLAAAFTQAIYDALLQHEQVSI